MVLKNQVSLALLRVAIGSLFEECPRHFDLLRQLDSCIGFLKRPFSSKVKVLLNLWGIKQKMPGLYKLSQCGYLQIVVGCPEFLSSAA